MANRFVVLKSFLPTLGEVLFNKIYFPLGWFWTSFSCPCLKPDTFLPRRLLQIGLNKSFSTLQVPSSSLHQLEILRKLLVPFDDWVLNAGSFRLDSAEEIWIKTSEIMPSMPSSREKPRLRVAESWILEFVLESVKWTAQEKSIKQYTPC